MDIFLSIIFFMTYSLYTFLGFVVFDSGLRKRQNRIFFGICIALGFWSLGYALSISAPTKEVALLWRRVSALGWVPLYALFLHFVYYFSEINLKIKYKRLLGFAIYIPVPFFLYMYMFSSQQVEHSYVMEFGKYGWENYVVVSNLWDQLYYAYYIIYTLLCIGILIYWVIENKNKRLVSVRLFLSIFIAFLLGSLIDVIIPSIFHIKLVKITPIVIAIPIGSIFYVAKNYNFMDFFDSIKRRNIINVEVVARLYDFISLSLVSGSIFNYYLRESKALLNPVSIFLMALAIFLQLIKVSRIKAIIKDMVLVYILFLMIPAAALYNLNRGGVTTWVGPILVAILFVLFNSKRIITYLSVSIITTQLLTFTYATRVEVRIGPWDHALRLAMYLLILLIAIFINNLYLDKIKQYNQQLDVEKRSANYDQLTELPNRALFTKTLTDLLATAKNSSKEIAILFLDLDGFKTINDTKGHDTGDKLLKHISDRLKCFVCEDTFVARFGGDEFLIIETSHKNKEELMDKAGSLLDLFKEKILIDDESFFVSASLGIARYPQDGRNQSQLISNADLAMYEAKKIGKSNYYLCDERIKNLVEIEGQLSNSLLDAIDNNQLHLVYQPQFNLNTNRICSCEALVRWEHPTMGRLSPAVFIPIAEKYNMINKLGLWVLERAIKQTKTWHDLGYTHLVMSVNISAAQFQSGTIYKKVTDLLSKYELEPKYLELEVTESLLFDDKVSIIKTLEDLQKLGVSIAIDDFGTGYSSFSRLKDLPINCLKMDISFVRNLEKSKKDRSVAQIIIEIAKQLDLTVVAEGVETKGQLNILENFHCDLIQGYYYYKPLLEEDFRRAIDACREDDEG